MATETKTPKNPAAPKKPAVAVSVRLTDQMKKAVLGGKLNADELDKLAALAGSLKVFLQA